MSLLKINFLSYLFYFQIFCLIFCGLFFINFGWSYDDVVNMVNLGSIENFTVFIALFVTLFSVFLLFFCKIFGVDRRKLEIYFSVRVNKESKLIENFVDVCFFTGACSFFYFLSEIGGIPLVKIFLGGMEIVEAAKIRSEASLNLNPGLNAIKLFAPILLQVSYFFYFSKFLNNEKGFILKIKIFTSFIFCMLSLAYAGDKAPCVFFIFGHLFCYVYIKSKLNSFLFSTFFVICTILIVIMYFINMKGFGDSMIVSFVNRVFVSQISGTYLALDHFGTVEDFIGISSQNATLSSFFGLESKLRASERLVEYYFYDSYVAGLFKNVNSFFMHEAWANYGWMGILFSPIWVAFLISLNLKFLLNSEKNNFNVAIFVYASYSIMSFSTSFNSYILSPQYILLLIVFFIGKFILNRRDVSRASPESE